MRAKIQRLSTVFTWHLLYNADFGIYAVLPLMSAKNVDRYNRFRSITVGFRVSPEEQEELNRAVALSGLPKQEYCYRKCMGREVVVQPNPRVHKALKTQMTAILAELERIAAGDSVPDELLSTIDLIAVTMQGLKGEDANE